MTEQTKIAKGLWWDRAWSLTHGCSHVSAECDHCWAEKMAHMRSRNPNDAVRSRHEGVTDAFGRWTGRVNIDWEALDVPGKIKAPATWAVWDDLFHESVPDEFIQAAIVRAASYERNTFVILTKRVERAANFLCDSFLSVPKNIFIGTTAGNSESVSRLAHLALIPTRNRVLSAEPILGPVDISKFVDSLAGVFCGGETGPGARPANIEWVRRLRDQCIDADVNFFFKGWGKHAAGEIRNTGRLLDGRTWDELPWEVSGE